MDDMKERLNLINVIFIKFIAYRPTKITIMLLLNCLGKDHKFKAGC